MYKNWVRQVFDRDSFTCDICNQVGGELNAHHLDGWNWCKEKRFLLSNGVTLCKKCHLNFHRVYGNGDNTRQQYEVYKEVVRE